ncbi:FkbM family methyltransferase [candidate division WOR-3 bacterium]|nr:FkbM family methyltransferase [candidate division WOR-3 bacterium]
MIKKFISSKLSYIIKLLNLGKTLKKVYFVSKTFFTKKKRLLFMKIEADFLVNDFDELKTIETFFVSKCKNEGIMLKSLLETLRPGDTAYDIGANIGIYTIFLAKKVGNRGKIIAFEPDSRNFDSLIRNIKTNKLNNVYPQKFALGDNNKKSNLYIDKRVGIGAISFLQREGSIVREEVQIIEGDSFIRKMKFAVPYAIKIDVEGYEYLVMKGLKKTLSDNSCKVLCCEIHSTIVPSYITKEAVLNLIRNYGFEEINTFSRGGEIHAVCYKR